MPHLYIGEMAPAFSIQDVEEKIWTQDDLKSKWTLLHFQTQVGDDMLKQIQYLNRLSMVAGADLQVLGVVVSNKYNQISFRKEHGISFPVLLDESLQVVRSFGTWEAFKGYHKSYMNVIASLFLIDPEGFIVWEKKHISFYDLPQLLETALANFDIIYNKIELEEASSLPFEEEQNLEEDLETLFEEELPFYQDV